LAVELFLGGGAFDAEDVAQTSLVLAAFAVSVPFESLFHLLSRAMYATRNTLLQVAASVTGFAVTVLAGQALAPEIGITAIPLWCALGTMVKVVLLGIALLPRVRQISPQVPPESLAPGR
ncbi:MAG: lipid II flippase MurJ, partial [Candidatus Limnocylindrales bacterium]